MKRNLIILLVAMALLAGILLKKRSDEKGIRSDSPVFDSTRSVNVASIRVGKKSDSAILQLKDGKWITMKDGFPVDTSKTNKVLKSIFSLQDKEMVSHNPARYSEYGLDSMEARHVVFLDASGKSMADVVIGKTSGSDFNSTYWQWTGKTDVYRTPGNFSWEIPSKDDEWKDRKLIQAQAKDLKTIETVWKDSTGVVFNYKLEATSDSTWKMVAPQDSSRIKKSLVSEMASRFVDMSIDEFVAEKDTNLTKVKIDSPAVDVKVTLKSGTLIEFKASKTLAGYAYTKHPTRQELIKLSAWRFDAFKKKPFELLDAPPVVIDTNKSAAKLVVPSKPNAPIKVEKFPNVKPSGPKPAK